MSLNLPMSAKLDAEWMLEEEARDLEANRNLSNYIDHPASGKTGTFAAKYDQHAERNGQSFTVLGAVDPSTYDADECGEMFTIRFADGVQIDAWPEEVQSAMNVSNYIDHAGAYRIAVPLESKLAKADIDRLTDAVRRAQDDVLSGGFALNEGVKTSITFFRDAENDMEFIASNFTDVAKRDVGAAAMLQLAGEIVDTRIENEHLREIVKTLRGESGMKASVDNLGLLSAAFKRGYNSGQTVEGIEQPINATIQTGVLTLPSGQSIDLTKVQAALNFGFQETGDHDLMAACDEMSKLTGLVQGPSGEFVPADNHQNAAIPRTAPDLSGVDAYALQRELERRGLLVQLWSAEDFEFIGNEDADVADLPDDTLEQIQQQAFEQCRLSLDEITAQRGNEHLGDWWAFNKQPILEQFKPKDEYPRPGM